MGDQDGTCVVLIPNGKGLMMTLNVSVSRHLYGVKTWSYIQAPAHWPPAPPAAGPAKPPAIAPGGATEGPYDSAEHTNTNASEPAHSLDEGFSLSI